MSNVPAIYDKGMDFATGGVYSGIAQPDFTKLLGNTRGEFAMTHKGTVTLETERLILRRFTIDDAEDAFYRWSGSAENARFIMKSPHLSVLETKEMLQEYIRDYDKPDFYMWGITIEGELIGYICGNEMKEETKSICIGYCITKSCWNKGITTEAAKAVIDFFFSIGFNRIYSYHNPLNPASGKVMQKCGMQFEGRIRGGSLLTGEICDCLQYAILANDKSNGLGNSRIDFG